MGRGVDGKGVGMREGSGLGASVVGPVVGLGVGGIEGSPVGEADGTAVGSALGAELGVAVDGLAVGSGLLVGRQCEPAGHVVSRVALSLFACQGLPRAERWTRARWRDTWGAGHERW